VIKSTKYRSILRTAVLIAFALPILATVSVHLHAQSQNDRVGDEKSSRLARDLVGTWVLSGTPDKPEEPPKSGGRLKFFTGKHWCITQADPKTGVVIFHHGGAYTLDGDEMSETIEYANDNTANYINRTHKFKIKVEGDTYTQTGQDNPFTEVWKRLK
jgi:acetyl esterase/lipase